MVKINFTGRPTKVRLLGVYPYHNLGGPSSFIGFPYGDEQLSSQVEDYSLATGMGRYPQFDLVGSILQGTTMDFGYHDFYFASGVSKLDTTFDKEFDGFFLQNKNYSEIIDLQPSNQLSLYLGLFHKAKLTPRMSRDHLLTHFNMRGRVQPKLDDPLLYAYGEDYDEFGGLRYPKFVTAGNTPGNMLFHRIYFDGTPATGNVLYDSAFDSQQRGDLKHVLDTLKGQIGFSGNYVLGNPYSHFGVCTYLLESLDYEILADRIDIHYQYSTSYSRTGPFAHFELKYEVNTSLVLEKTGLFSTTLADNYVTPVAFNCVPSFKWKLISGFSRYVDPEDHEIKTIAQFPYANSLSYESYIRSTGGYGPFYGSKSINGYIASPSDIEFALQLSAGEHGNFWNDRKQLLQCSAVFAFQNALESHFKLLDTNFDEVLSEIEGINEFVPDIQLLLQSLSDIRRFRLSGLVKLGDFITSEHLRYNFGTAPNLRAIAELNLKGDRINDLFNRGLESRTGIFQGSFAYKFLDQECHPYLGSRLSVKSSVSVTYCPTPFLKVLMDLYGIRVLPTLQNFWETLPFSFVADWFTNMGSRLRVLDLSALTLMVRINNSEFTYRVTSPIPDKSTLRGYVMDVNDIQHSTYFRDLTLHVPSLITESGIDYLRTAVNLNAGIFGSLIAQVGGSQVR